MAASKQTISEMLGVIKKYIPHRRNRINMLTELLRIDGNKSFKETVKALWLLNARETPKPMR